jgi:uncharacterized protein YcbX
MAAKSLPCELVIELDRDPAAQGWELTEVKGGTKGYKMGADVNSWFSCALDVDCFALHSELDRVKPNKPAKAICMKEGDQSKTFVSQAPIHVINEASLRALSERCLQRHPENTAADF